MKRIGYLLMGVLLVLSTTLFSEGTKEGNSQKKIHANIASVFPPEGPVHEGMVKFKEIIEQKSNGRIEVTIHPSGALGAEREVVEGLKSGTIEMGAEGIMDLIMYMPEYTVFEEPYVIRDVEHLRKFWDTIGKEINEKLKNDHGIITAGIAIRGSRLITANKPIYKPEDLAGLRFRLPSYPVRIKVFEAFGAVPTVVAFPEVYMALKTGTVDAQENPPETIYTYKFYETQKYLIDTKHVWSTARYQISSRWFETLAEEDQAMILSAWKEAEAYVKDIAYDPDQKFIDLLIDNGMELIEPDAEAFRALADPVMKEFDEKQWAPGLRQRIMSLN